MLQFFFLSIVSNCLAGTSLCSDSILRSIPSLASWTTGISTRRGKMVAGLSSLLVGFATLFFPVQPPLILGDLFPSVAGMVMGIALLFEVFKQDSVLPAEAASDKQVTQRVGYRTTIGVLGLAAAVLHFFMPERPFL